MAPHLTLQQREHARRLRREGRTIREIAAEIGCSRSTVKSVVRGPAKRESRQVVWSPGPLRLSLADREEISRGLSAGDPLRAIARQLGRAPSTIAREVKANGGRSHYRAVRAHHGAYERARRPKTQKLAGGPLCTQVTVWLEE